MLTVEGCYKMQSNFLLRKQAFYVLQIKGMLLMYSQTAMTLNKAPKQSKIVTEFFSKYSRLCDNFYSVKMFSLRPSVLCLKRTSFFIKEFTACSLLCIFFSPFIM